MLNMKYCLVQSIFGFNVSERMEGTNVRCFNCSNTLVTAAIPAADSQCPIFDFTEPMGQTVFLFLLNALFNPAISMGSPNDVPVPWAST